MKKKSVSIHRREEEKNGVHFVFGYVFNGLCVDTIQFVYIPSSDYEYTKSFLFLFIFFSDVLIFSFIDFDVFFFHKVPDYLLRHTNTDTRMWGCNISSMKMFFFILAAYEITPHKIVFIAVCCVSVLILFFCYSTA